MGVVGGQFIPSLEETLELTVKSKYYFNRSLIAQNAIILGGQE